ncbi:MAG: 30S ribosomal protein S8 [Acidiferrobacterales bacterium]|nr:30S ribosomal protein S8 [Acidiferrobacterales bacterium]
MSMTDPIADMLTRVRNGGKAERVEVSMPGSGMKREIARVLKEEGYIVDYSESGEATRRELTVKLKYYRGQPVIESINRVSRPGRRVYRGQDELPSVSGGLGIAIISTSQGVMTAKKAQAARVGGEVICTVS